MSVRRNHSPSHLNRARELGQASIEWVGVLALIGLIFALLLAMTPSFPTQVSHAIVCSVETIIGDGNACSSSATGPGSNVVVCKTSTSTNTAQDQVQLFFIQVGHNNTLIETHYSNGSVSFTLVDTGSVEAQAKLIQLEAEAGNIGFDLNVSAAAGGQLTGSHTWTFPNAQLAKQFAGAVSGAGGWGVIAHDFADNIPIAGPVLGWLLSEAGVNGAPDPSSLSQKYLSSSYVAAGAVGQLNALASASAPEIGSAQLSAVLSAAGGFREITSDNGSDGLQKGDVQIYVNLSGTATGVLQQGLFGPNAGGQGQGNAVAIVTLNQQGKPIQLSVTGAVSGTGNGGAGGGYKGPENGGEGSGGTGGSGGTPGEGEGGAILKGLNLNMNLGSGQGYQYTGTLNLANDPNAASMLLGLLSPSSSGASMTQILAQMQANGKQQVQPFGVTSSQSGGGLNGEIADVGGGVTVQVSSQNQQLSPGWIEPPGGSWEQVVCAQ